MAAERQPDNIIFQFKTTVKDKDDPAKLAAGIEVADQSMKEANRTVEAFDKGVAKSLATWKASRAEQDKATAGAKTYTATLKDTNVQVGKMSDTVGKAKTALVALRGIGQEEAGFLKPFITRAEDLGKKAKTTGGDLEFLKKQTKELAQIPLTQVAPQRAGSPAAPATPIGQPAAPVSNNAEALRQNTAEVKSFAEALVRLSNTGTVTFDELKNAARNELEILKEANAEASKTPQGAAALKVDLDNAQKEALDLLVTTKAITAEERAQLEVSTKLANAARRPAVVAPVAPNAPTVAGQGTGTSAALAETKALGDAAKETTVDYRALAEQLVAAGLDAQKAFDALPQSLQEDTRLLEQLVAIASEEPGGAEALAKSLGSVQTNSLKSLQAIGALSKEEAKTVEQALKLSGATAQADTNTKKVSTTWSSLRRQVQQAKADLDQLVEASDGNISPELIKAAKHAAELDERFIRLQKTVDAFNPEKRFEVFTGVIENVAGGFTTAQAAAALFGKETEGVEKALIKVEGALALVQGLKALFGNLKDNLRSLRLILVANAGAAETLAVAEGEAAAGATAQTAATTGLSGALTIAKGAAVQLWATLVANPIGIIVAAIAVLVATVIALASAEEEAEQKADDLLAALDRVSKARTTDIGRNKTSEALENDRKALEEINALERERAAIPRSYTEDQKALANLRIDQKIAAVEERQRQEQARLDIKALAQERAVITDEQINVEDALQRLYAKGGEVYVDAEDKKAAAAAERLGGLMNVTEQEGAAALKRARVLDRLNDEEIEGLKKLEERREALLEAEEKNNSDRATLRAKETNDRLKAERDLTKALAAENALRAKAAEDGLVKGTIAALQKQQQELLDIITKKAVIRSPEFFAAIDKYQEVTEKLKAAQDLLKDQEVFPAGSLADLNQELAFLRSQLDKLPEGAEDFNTVKDAVNELQAAVDALNEKLKPTDPKAITAAKLAELEEIKRHHQQVAELDQQAALIRARNEHKSEADIKKIEEDFHQQRLKDELDFERQRLAILQAAGKDKAGEVKASLDKIRELELELNLPADTTGDDKDLKAKVDRITTAAQQIAQAGIDAWQAWSDAQARSLDQQIEVQRNRVSEVQKLADKGNAEILQKEKDRLQQLTDARQRAAERNAAIAQLEAAANAVVAITRAAAEGGGFLSAVTIASTLIALTAGILQARSLASDSVPVQGFYKGTKFVDREGRYPKGVDTVPANLTRGERVVDAATSAHHRTLYDGLQDRNVSAVRLGILQTAARYGLTNEIRRALLDHTPFRLSPVATPLGLVGRIPPGRMDMRHMMPKQSFVVIRQGESLTSEHVRKIVNAIHDQPRTSVRLDADGLTVEMTRRAERARALGSRL